VAQVENSIVVDRSIEEVWDFFLVWDNTPRWYRSMVRCHQRSDGPVGEGTVVEMFARFGPGWRVQIVNFEPHRLIVFRGVGGFGSSVTARFIFEPVEGGTRFTKLEDYRGLSTPLGWIAPKLRKIREPFFAEFKRLLESPAVETEPAPIHSRTVD
jgi:uncharacterized protein YndB with AHSA1/START domain